MAEIFKDKQWWAPEVAPDAFPITPPRQLGSQMAQSARPPGSVFKSASGISKCLASKKTGSVQV